MAVEKVKAELIGNRIHVVVPTTIQFSWRKDACKSVRGAQWNPQKKRWTYPLTWATCLEIRAKIANELGLDLLIGPELTKWAKMEKERREHIPSVSSMERVPLPILEQELPHLFKAVNDRPFQTVGIAFAARNRACIIGDEPGLGKTLQAIGAAVELGLKGKFLIVAPKTAGIVTWPHELARWAPDDRVVQLAGIAKLNNKPVTDVQIEFARDEKGNIERDSYTNEPIIASSKVVTLPSPRQRYIESAFSDTDEEGVKHERTWYIVSPHWVRAKAELDDRGNFKRGPKGEKIIKTELPQLFDQEWAGVIVDESHDMLICNTANRKKWTQTRVGMANLDIREDGLKLAMSGTPTRGKNQNFWGTLNWLQPQVWTSYWKWAQTHFEFFQNDDGKEMAGTKNYDEFYAELADVLVRRTKSEVAADLPAKIYGGTPLDPHDETSPVGIWLPMDGKQKASYEAMAKHGSVQLEGGNLIANGILSEWMRLKQLASADGTIKTTTKIHKATPKEIAEQTMELMDQGYDGEELEEQLIYEWEEETSTLIPNPKESNKFQWLLEFLDDRGISAKSYGDQKVVVASQFAKLVEAYAAELVGMGIPVHVLTGNTKPEDRAKMQKEWQAEGGPRVFFLSTKAGGVSLTLDSADDVVILDETWIPDDQLQVEDRAHRISRPDHQVSIWYVRTLGTIEEAIAHVTGGREAEMRLLLDGTRGVDIRKKVVEYHRKMVEA